MAKDTSIIKELLSNYLTSKHLVLTAQRIKDIRKSYGLSQTKFSDLIMVKFETYRKWEYDYYQPSSPGKAILLIAEKHPDIFLKYRAQIIKKINSNKFPD